MNLLTLQLALKLVPVDVAEGPKMKLLEISELCEEFQRGFQRGFQRWIPAIQV